MTVEAWTRTPVYIIAGIGPYTVTHPYVEGAIRVAVIVDGLRQILGGTSYSLSPVSAEIEGNLFLTPGAAATHAGRQLIIDRLTPDEQGWIATQGEREAGLADQLDRMVQVDQELRADVAGALRLRSPLEPFEWADGTVPLRQGSRVVSGPTAAQIAEAAASASAAASSASAAATSAAQALARELSMLRDRGNWTTALFYSPSDIVTINGSAYICQAAHFGTVFATDLAAARWRLFAAKGDAGAGTGDMLKTENLSGLPNYPQARTNLGLGALATKALAAFADLDPLAIITALETLLANKTVENAVPTAKAVADYVDKILGREFLAERVAANSGTLDFTEFNNAIYKWYDFEFDYVLPATNAVRLLMRFSTNGGLSYDAAAASYYMSGTYMENTTGPANDGGPLDGVTLLTNGRTIGNAAGQLGVRGSVRMYGAGNAAGFTEVAGKTWGEGNGGAYLVSDFSTKRIVAQDTDAVRVLASTGNVATGKIRMYGRRA